MSQNKLLFGAEVNRIQDTLFSANGQRQVVGGSRLLAEFGDLAARKATSQFGAEKVLVKAGGNFRIVFPKERENDAHDFGRFLTNAFHLLLDGVMTLVDPIPFDEEAEDGFQEANKLLSQALGQQKHGQSPLPLTVSHPQVPTTAFCQSSGSGLAANYCTLDPNDGTPQYVSAVAYKTHLAGRQTKIGRDAFLDKISQWFSDKHYQSLEWANKPEDLSRWDLARRNVAYLVADGNNMGKYFGKCQTPEQLTDLSNTLQTVVQKAIATAVGEVTRRLWDDTPPTYLPALPLIAAGDDVFILLAAPYALDVARTFCLAFEKGMEKADPIKNLQKIAQLPPPKMSAAIVFCKESYPYRLAHEHGEHLLKQTKQVTKTVGREAKQWLSAVSATVIMGSELAHGNESTTACYCAGLTTYWAISQEKDEKDKPVATLTDAARKAAVDLQAIFEQRLRLNVLPQKRLNELLMLFDALPPTEPERVRWDKRLQTFYQRLQATHLDDTYSQLIDKALTDLGDGKEEEAKKNPGHWLSVHRSGQQYWGQGFPDLITLWPYAQSLEEALGTYREGRGS